MIIFKIPFKSGLKSDPADTFCDCGSGSLSTLSFNSVGGGRGCCDA